MAEPVTNTPKLVIEVPILDDEPETSQVVDDNRALRKIREGLYSVKVSKQDATEVQRKLGGGLFSKWNENLEVMSAKAISVDDIDQFIDHMKDAYDGVDEHLAKQMKGIHWAGEWTKKIMEFRYVEKSKMKKGDAPSGAKYGMVAFGKSADRKYVDCMYLLYTMSFELAPKVIVTVKQHSLLWGLFNWTTEDVREEEMPMAMDNLVLMKNFFREKALQGFLEEGIIEEINYVPSLNQITD